MSDLTLSKQVLAIIPAYNEQAAITQVIRGVRKVLPQADIVVIDDGSTDQTAPVAQAAGAVVLRQPINIGIGGTVQTGLKFARDLEYSYVVRLDGDGQHNPQDIPPLLEAVRSGRTDVAIGSRFLHGRSNMHVSLSRRLGIRFFALTVSLLTHKRATDTTSGFAVMNQRAVRVLAHYLPQDYPEVEGRIILYKAGLTTIELPVKMRERVAGVSSIDNWRSLYYSIKVSIAVLLTAVKDVSATVEGRTYACSACPTINGRYLQSHHPASDHLSDPQAQAA